MKRKEETNGGVSITEITSGRLSWARASGGRNPLLSDDRPIQCLKVFKVRRVSENPSAETTRGQVSRQQRSVVRQACKCRSTTSSPGSRMAVGIFTMPIGWQINVAMRPGAEYPVANIDSAINPTGKKTFGERKFARKKSCGRRRQTLELIQNRFDTVPLASLSSCF